MANKQVANLNKEGMLSLNGVIDERSSPKVGNLIHHIPFDNKEGIDKSEYIPSVNFLNTGVEDKIQDSHNLLDAVGFDWRNPSNWYGSGSTVKYNEEYDCLEITGARYIYGFGSVPIIHNKKFNISCDVWQVYRSSVTRIYVGGKYYGENGTARPTSEHIPGSWDYTSFCGNQLQPNDGWVTGHNKYIGGVPRQGIGTSNSQWKNDNGKFYQPLILANYAGTSTDVVRIRNLRIWYSDDNIDNNTEYTGLSTQVFNDSVNNLYPPLTSTYGYRAGWGGLSCKTHKISMPNGENGIRVVTQGALNGGVNINTTTQDIVVKPLTEYTLSFMMRTNDPNNTFATSNLFYTREHNAAGTLIKSAGRVSISAYNNGADMGDGWRYVTISFTTIADTVKLKLNQYLYRRNIVVEFGNVTLVEGKSSLYIPYGKTTSKSKPLVIKTMDLPSFTIVSKFINSKPMVNDVDGGLHSGAILMSLKSTNGSVHVRNWISGGKSYLPYLDPDTSKDWNESTSNRHTHIGLNLYAGQLTYLVVKFSSSDKKLSFSFFNDKGNKIAGGTMPATANTPLLKEIILGHTSIPWDAQHLDLKVYNSSLSDELINTIINSKVNVDDGIMSETISEKLDRVNLPLLDLPTRKNEYGQGYQTSNGRNSICPSDTSQWPYPNRPNIDRTIITPYGNGIKFMSGSVNGTTSGNNTAYMFDDNGSFTLDDYVCFSAWVYVSKDCDLSSVRLKLEQGASSSKSYDLGKKGQWQFLQIKTKITTAGNLRSLLYLYNNKKSSDFDGYVIYSDITLSKDASSQGASPTSKFNNLAFNERSLQLNLHDDFKFDWSKDWTIQYWKRPMGSQTGDHREYCIDSIGSNSNSVGGGYLWWGKSAGSNDIRGVGSFNPDEFWNHWRLITLTYNSSSKQIIIYEQDKFKTFKRTVSQDITTANRFVTQYGYDLMLGGWDNGHICVAEYKDIRVSQHLLTESEIYDCFKQGMSQKDVLTLNGELIENAL